MSNPVRDALLGLAIGDALGVPVEFESRETLADQPVIDMRGFGTYNQVPGTWSDDSSLTFCLAESLSKGFDLTDIAQKFVDWRYAKIWTPHGNVFDIGITTREAISVLEDILAKKDYDALQYLHFEADEMSNGNGSLMRILPLLFYLKDHPNETWFDTIWRVSALTHGHIRAAISCWYYLRFALHLLQSKNKREAYLEVRTEARDFLKKRNIVSSEQRTFSRLVDHNISILPSSEIHSSGYVIHSLEAAMWCLLRYNSYEETVLAAVNLGNDTDTTAAIVGGLAGILYGEEAIPSYWLEQLIKLKDIEKLCDTLAARTQVF